MPLPPGKVAPMQVLNFTISCAKRASRRSFASTRKEAKQIRQQELQMTPETAGKWAQRLNLERSLSKTTQQRFIDMFA